MPFFKYGAREIVHLQKRDRKLGAAIERLGPIERETTPDLFQALVETIVSQQISGKAARTICRRLYDCLEQITPANLAALEQNEIQQCGMSMRKAGYLKNLAHAVLTGRLELNGLSAFSDQEVTKKLVALDGIGLWSAEMLLLFSLERPDIVSWGDLAIRRGMMNLYNLNELSKEQFERYRKRYSPYGSVASLYLWKISVQ